MSAQMLAADAQKIQLANSFHASLRRGTSADLASAVTASAPSSKVLAANQQTQINETYCGPATVSESLGQIPSATHLTQSQAATALHTNNKHS